ncbi:MAG: DUF4430 domain-containing protein [Oscillospiraceae bacterium]|nr:DUF4430 domain-containing protein [Oscillospiraceae bacterium]
MNKKIIVAIVALVAVVGIFLGVYFALRPETQAGAKQITVVVVHKDGTEKTFTYHTDEEYLDKVLLAEGLITGYEDQYGLVIEKVDGEAAIWETDSAYWSLYVGEEYATTGISTTPVYDGSTFKLVYESWSE